MKRIILLSISVIAVCSSRGEARKIPNWGYKKLANAADVIVIGEMVSAQDSQIKLAIQMFGKWLVGQVTTFRISTVLKGKPKGDRIEVLHYRLKKGIHFKNGPILAVFRRKGRFFLIEAVDGVKTKAKIGEGKPFYLLFLKRRKDGKYEPVSGQVESGLSVRRLAHVGRFN